MHIQGRNCRSTGRRRFLEDIRTERLRLCRLYTFGKESGKSGFYDTLQLTAIEFTV